MERKDIIKFINETISSPEFDFLGLSRIHEEENNYKLMNEYEFQQKFLYDLLFNKTKIKIKTSEAKIRKESEDDLTKGRIDIEYSAEITYEYNERELEFEILFEGDGIEYKVTQSERDGRKTIVIDWDSINYEIYSNIGDSINFHIFDKIKDKRIERKFIKEFIGIFIEREILD
jgi:hypothetical protein